MISTYDLNLWFWRMIQTYDLNVWFEIALWFQIIDQKIATESKFFNLIWIWI